MFAARPNAVRYVLATRNAASQSISSHIFEAGPCFQGNRGCVTLPAHHQEPRRSVLVRSQASTESDSRALSIVKDLGRAYAQKFRSCCILAYECGYREEDIALMFTELCDKGACPIPASNVPQCMELACIVWETLEQSAKSVKRWSQAPVLTDATQARWKGFVALICNAYFEKRMASFPLDRLQLELKVSGRVERDDTVAEWSRLVYETLNHVAPQFPKN